MIGHLLQPSHNRAVHGLYVGDAPMEQSQMVVDVEWKQEGMCLVSPRPDMYISD
jgi:hypothetical protein